jgi:co-chaperonin GroES (HSP10)
MQEFRPQFGYALGAQVSQDNIEKRESGLLLSKNTAEETIVRCQVCTINQDSESQSPDLEVGDTVILFKEDAGQTIVLEGKPYIIFHATAVVGRLTEGTH